MSAYDERPWLSLYDEHIPAEIVREYDSVPVMFDAALRRAPDLPVIKYFDGTITMSELDESAGALAVALAEQGFARGDRLALFMQNVPQFVIAALATWKAGGIVVPVNPMYRERELATVLADSGATFVVCLESLYPVVDAARAGTSVRQVITTSELEYQSRNDSRVFSDVERARPEGAQDMAGLLER